MKVEELEALLELIKAMIVNNSSEHVEDAVRFNSLKDEFVEKFCSSKTFDGSDYPFWDSSLSYTVGSYVNFEGKFAIIGSSSPGIKPLIVKEV